MASKLQKELKQTKPFASIREEVYLGIQFTAEILKTILIETLKSVNLTLAQYNVLRILRGAGKEGACVREIGDRMITKDSDVTRLLDRLEVSELIKRERQTDDRRIVRTFISDEGLTLLTDLDRRISECHEQQLGHLSGKQLKELSKLLDFVRSGSD